jgi:hypothetical protein
MLGLTGGGTVISTGVGVTAYRMTMIDSGGVRVMHITTDSAGHQVTRTTIDSLVGTRAATIIAGPPTPMVLSPAGSPTNVVRAINGGSLTSGIASMKQTIDDFNAGRLMSYQSIISMTKTTGWK